MTSHFLKALSAWSFVFLLANPAQAAGDYEFFETKVRPVLATQCYACHSAKSKIVQGNLRLDSRDGAMRGGQSGPAIIPGDPASSRLLKLVRHESTPSMPPWGKIKPEEIAALEEWVKRGAPWPEEKPVAEAPVKTVSKEDRAKHRAWQPVRDFAAPAVSATSWSSDPVDRFLLAKLEQSRLTPNRPAAPAALLRRVYLDLTGLPPSPAAVQAFERDPSPAAYARIVDDLLAASSFGERWGRHWLDITYFGDTIDTQGGVPASHAWRYRDYVIKSFNHDKPVNRFITEQIAGDQLPYKDGFEQRELISATGYLALGPWALVQADKEQLKMDVIDLQVDGIGRGLMGLTLGCARCHDHKFDPIAQKEYYGIAGIFSSTRTLHGKLREAGVFSDVNKVPLYESDDERTARTIASAQHKRAMEDLLRLRKQLEARKESIKADTSKVDELKDIDGQLQRLTRREGMLVFNQPEPPAAYALQDEEQPADCRVTIRGNAHQLGEPAPRTFVRAAMFGQTPATLHGSGRLELARWIADDRNPLTARVYVNRVWQQLFGAGIVRSADNFGLRGDRPTHPELLDYLARTFLADGWSTKKLIRRLVLTRSYQMSAAATRASMEADPENKLLWRMSPRRLEAETIRDAILVITGRYDPTAGGPTLPTDNLETFAPDLGKVNPPRMVASGRLPERLRNRRTVYLPVYRQAQMDDLDVLNLFDFANNAQVNATRRQAVVPTQPLFLMNSAWIREQSGALAKTMLESEQMLEYQRIEALILSIYNRAARPDEVVSASNFILELEQELSKDKTVSSPVLESWTRYIQTLFVSNEFLFRS